MKTMNIRLRQLRVFKLIVETGTVSEAAQAINLGQSSVSKTLASLEEELGFLLFDRIGRRLKLSQQGQIFYRKIENALETIEGIETTVRDIRDNQGQRLRIAAIGPLLHSKLIPETLTRFAQQKPDFNYSVDMIPRIEMEDYVAQRLTDIGFTLLPVETNQLNFRPIATVNAVAAVPANHVLANREILRPADLTEAHIVMPKPMVRVRGLVEASFIESGVNLRVKTQVTSAICAIHLIAQGMGIGILDPFTVSGMKAANITVIPWEPEIKLSYGVIWPKSRSLSESEEELIIICEQVAQTLTAGLPNEACLT